METAGVEELAVLRCFFFGATFSRRIFLPIILISYNIHIWSIRCHGENGEISKNSLPVSALVQHVFNTLFRFESGEEGTRRPVNEKCKTGQIR